MPPRLGERVPAPFDPSQVDTIAMAKARTLFRLLSIRAVYHPRSLASGPSHRRNYGNSNFLSLPTNSGGILKRSWTSPATSSPLKGLISSPALFA